MNTSRYVNWIVVLFLLGVSTVFLASTPFSVVFATSGCCSGRRGGVNCSAGAQPNGAVICKDGWTGSSCQYSSMTECVGSMQAPRSVIIPAPVTPRPTTKPFTSIILSSPTALPSPTPSSVPITQSSNNNSSDGVNGFVIGAIVGGVGGWWLTKKKPKKEEKLTNEKH